MTMGIDGTRRQVLLIGAMACTGHLWASPQAVPLRLLTAWQQAHQAWAGVWTPGQVPRGVALPSRAHEVLAVPGRSKQALVVARRPGEYLLRMDTWRNRALLWHAMETDRLLCGHAVFSPDGRHLYTSEVDAQSGVGWIAERDPLSLRRLREFSSGGVGPHALLFEPQGTLWVANGGLLTLPETGRRKLNQADMHASLVRIDVARAQVVQSWTLDDPFLSLRHLARAPTGVLAVALQAEHSDPVQREQAPLLALLQGQDLRTLPLPQGFDLRGYAGDVAYVAPSPSQLEGRFVVSANRAARVLSWSVGGDYLGCDDWPEAGALTAQGDTWTACGGQGRVRQNTGQQVQQWVVPGLTWDNHAHRV